MNTPPDDASPSPAGNVRILILEDVPTDAELMQRALRHDGLVITAKRVDTEPDFMAALADFAPDIVLADFKLPSYDGLSAVTYVRNNYAALPVIVVTGALRDETAIELMKAGAVDYVLKDRLARLPAAVRGALAAVKRAEALRSAEASVHAMARHSHDPIVVTDEKLTITFWNEAAQKCFGYSAAEAAGRKFSAFFARAAEAVWIEQEIAQSLASGETERTGGPRRFDITRKDGTAAPFDLSVSATRHNGTCTVTIFAQPGSP